MINKHFNSKLKPFLANKVEIKKKSMRNIIFIWFVNFRFYLTSYPWKRSFELKGTFIINKAVRSVKRSSDWKNCSYLVNYALAFTYFFTHEFHVFALFQTVSIRDLIDFHLDSHVCFVSLSLLHVCLEIYDTED